MFKGTTEVLVNDRMQKGYVYSLTESVGKNFAPDFKPQLTPKQMLEMGIFRGRYMRDCKNEFPPYWFLNAKLHPQGLAGHSENLNFFKIVPHNPYRSGLKKVG